MRPFDWFVLVVYIVWIVVDGLRRSKGTDKVEGYFLANRSLPWWAVGLSVIATQMSAVTLVGTTGQAYSTGLRFIQFYFGLPVAMIILSLTVVPFFHRAKVYTAYEYLERRFDVRTRSLASFLFLMGRAFSLGVTLAAPAVVISAILGWRLPATVFLICVLYGCRRRTPIIVCDPNYVLVQRRKLSSRQGRKRYVDLEGEGLRRKCRRGN